MTPPCLTYSVLLLIMLSSVLGDALVPSVSAGTPPVSLDAAFVRLNKEQDRFYTCFIVFDNRDSGNENFHPSGFLGDFEGLGAEQAKHLLNTSFSEDLNSGKTCAKLSYSAEYSNGKGWGGISWDFPEGFPNGPGYDLSHYKFKDEKPKLRFRAKANVTTEATFAFRSFDQFGRDETVTYRSTLFPQWQDLSLDLQSCSLRNVTGGISVSTQAPIGGVTKELYLGDVRIQFGKRGTEVRLNQPHFTRSYIPASAGEPDKYFRNSCFSYDNALMILAYCARKEPDDLRRAKLIADAFIQVQDADPYKDGRIRNGYSCGELLLAQPNQSPNCLQPRLPGFWNNARNSWSQDEYCAGTDCGNMAWVGIALLDFCEKNGENRESIYFQALARICQWIYNYTYCTGGLGGYRGGVSQVEKSPEYPDGQAWIPWKSCEHNIDIFVLFSRFARLSREEVWAQRANHAKEFVVNMRDPEDQHLFTGTLPDDTINKSVRPLDVNPWALMAFEDPAVFGPSVISAATHSALSVPVRGATATGFDFNDDLDGIWWEGTAQMALAFRMLVDVKRSEELLQSIRMFGGSPSYPGAIMAATKDGLTTGFLRPDKTPWLYWARPHIGGATCWYIFSELKWNPYWGKPLEPLNLYQTPSLK